MPGIMPTSKTTTAKFRFSRAARAALQLGFLAATIAVIPPAPCGAQEAVPDTLFASPGVLQVTSDPPGALVVLEGGHTVRGRAPFTVARGLTGRYDVSAYSPGYEVWHSTIYIDPAVNSTLAVQLSRKARFKAAGRSALFPGWGQSYTGQKGKALLFATLATGALIWTGVEHVGYANSVNDLEAAEDAYLAARREDEIERLYVAMERRRADAEEKFDDRRVALIATGAVWAVNLLDAILFFPSSSEGFYSELGSAGEIYAGFRTGF